MLTGEDIEAAAAELKMLPEEFIDTYTALARNRAQLTLKEQRDGACVFLETAGACRIYGARPQQCRDFPHGWHVEGCPGREGRET